MGRRPTYRSNYDDLKKLTLADLKRLGFMNGFRSGNVEWKREGEVTGTIGVTVNTIIETDSYVELTYTYNNTERLNYRLRLIQLPSNLDKGKVWYFICPITGERCRTLYQVDKYFGSRKALSGTLYESQTYSKHARWFASMYIAEAKADKASEELYKPYMKRHYRGKPTLKTRRAMKWDAVCNANYGLKPAPLEDYIYR